MSTETLCSRGYPAGKDVKVGYRYVVDLDLEKFFDPVNPDGLMSRIARKVTDKVRLRLIRRELRARGIGRWHD
ncbi:hypothetical protein [Leptothermofonsia sp. ETS-13]|uniref:hypothetical protein n=1 Tax=Leptothermofonsia sp. ETS-13 TaxID=3035696 RepID=UPI003BA31840